MGRSKKLNATNSKHARSGTAVPGNVPMFNFTFDTEPLDEPPELIPIEEDDDDDDEDEPARFIPKKEEDKIDPFPLRLNAEELTERFRVISELTEIIPYLLGCSLTILTLSWLYSRYNQSIFNFFQSCIIKSMNLVQYILKGATFILYYLAIIVIVLLFIAGLLTWLAYSFHTSRRTRSIIYPIYDKYLVPGYNSTCDYLESNPKVYSILLSSIFHSPLLILYRFLPKYILIPTYFYAVFRLIGQAYFDWGEIETLIVIPASFLIIILALIKYVALKLGWKKLFESKEEKEIRIAREEEETKMREMEMRKEEVQKRREKEKLKKKKDKQKVAETIDKFWRDAFDAAEDGL